MTPVLIKSFCSNALTWYECITEDHKTTDFTLYATPDRQSGIPARMTITKSPRIWEGIKPKEMGFAYLIQQLGECIEGMQRTGEFK